MVKYYENKKYNAKFSRWMNYSYDKLTKINDYLYEIYYNDIDYEFATDYLKKQCFDLGRCSAVRNGNFYGRNFDWYYDEEVSFIVHTPRIENRYASIGIANGMALTKDVVENREDLEEFKILPFLTVDGINEWGLTCNNNVVPTGEYGYTLGTNLFAKESYCDIMLIRYILDYFKTAKEAVEYVRDNINVYTTNTKEVRQDTHIMVADASETYLIEFINNQCVVKEISDKPYMTNFYLNAADIWDADGKADYDKVTQFADGVERYNLIVDNYSNLNTLDNMKNFMRNDLKYTNTYTLTDNKWYTEHCGETRTFGKLTAQDAKYNPEKFDDIMIYEKHMFDNRDRTKPETWQTTHTSIIDMSELKMYVTTQEDNSVEYVVDLNKDLNGSVIVQ